MGYGGGKGWGGGGGGAWNWMDMMWMMKGKGKGKSRGLRSFDGNVRVWIGGLPEKGEVDRELNKKLKEHMSSTGLTCIYAEVGRKGQGGAAFKTEEDAQNAILMLNGSTFEGVPIQVDKLTKKSPEEKAAEAAAAAVA
eukprot:TRINITY_DN13214_c0_g1_i1.p1 TRINITY_DN13214_c0_g1~~TRINITY_DN13214_c0_g1_i1.p1  ORF type:complete len:158 (+),score=43.31 TRINITY_DN13214_c0_g1_i1:62-475(+)